MNSIILRAATKLIVPLQLMFSIFLFLRGHNEPGGGFIAGLVAVAALSLHALVHGPEATRKGWRVDPLSVAGAGLLVSVASGLGAVLLGSPFMTGLWGGAVETWVAGPLKLGTPVLFDLGVYLAVAGGGLTLILSMLDEEGE